MTITSYPSIYNVGNREVEDIFTTPVLIEEKVDGSQISFGLVGDNDELVIRSKGRIVPLDEGGMFKKAIDYIVSIQHKLRPNLTYRGEYLQKPKHNTLPYNRVPENNIVVFDISDNNGGWLSVAMKKKYAWEIGLETVTCFEEGIIITSPHHLLSYLDNDSMLGGVKIEGVVIKNYNVPTIYGNKVMFAKYVSERFKEKHSGAGKEKNPNTKDVVENIITIYKTEARWVKAAQHLRDDGLLSNSPKDIGGIIKEVKRDVLEDSEYEIKEMLFRQFWPIISNGIIKGLPEWWKEELLKSSFKDENGETNE